MFGFTAVVFGQAATGYMASYHASFTEATVTEYSTEHGEESVDIRVDNPTREDLRITTATVNAFEGDRALTQSGRQVLSEPIVVPAEDTETLTVPLTLHPDEGDTFRESETIRFDGRIVIEIGDDRQFVDIETEVDR